MPVSGERRGVFHQAGLSRSPLIVKQQDVALGEGRKVGADVVLGKSWPAVKDNDRIGTAPHQPVEELGTVARRHESFLDLGSVVRGAIGGSDCGLRLAAAGEQRKQADRKEGGSIPGHGGSWVSL